MIISFRQRLQCLPILAGGLGFGALIAVVAQARMGAEPFVAGLVAVLPFILAAMTGVAKTTTV